MSYQGSHRPRNTGRYTRNAPDGGVSAGRSQAREEVSGRRVHNPRNSHGSAGEEHERLSSRSRSNYRNHTGSAHDYSMSGEDRLAYTERSGRSERSGYSSAARSRSTNRQRVSVSSRNDYPEEPQNRSRGAVRAGVGGTRTRSGSDASRKSSYRERSANQDAHRNSRERGHLQNNHRNHRNQEQYAGSSRSSRSEQRSSRSNRSQEVYLGGKPASQGLSRRAFIGAAAAGAFALIFGGIKFAEAQPITITVNGQEMKLAGGHNLQELAKQGGFNVKPGDYVAVDGSVIKAGEGYPFTARAQGEILTDYQERLHDGAVLELTNGANIEEPADEKETPFPVSAQERGHGPLHEITEHGKEGVEVQLTGKVSGKTVRREKVKMQPRLYDRRYPDVKDDKVVCFTFDDGPLPKYTQQILDILKENDAKATFFTVGLRIEDSNGAALVKREREEGHEVCTHTWDHAAGSGNGVDLSLMSAKEQHEEVQKGLEAIKKATGEDAPRILRAPGGNFPLEVWRNVEDLIDLEVGWDIDSTDWKRPGVDSIYQAMMSVTPGDIVLCHDGGGNRQQTVDALKRALPDLKKQGFRFITVSELAQYPLKESKDKIHDAQKTGKHKSAQEKSDANLNDKPGEITGEDLKS